MMNDEFLTQFREVPRAEFANALYERISREAQPHVSWTLAKKLTFRNAIIVFAFLFFIAACVYAVSAQRWNKVGGIWVDVQKTIKLEFPPGEPIIVEPSPDYECLTVEEAREILRFELPVPAWAPEGFTFDNKICGIDLDQTWDFAGMVWIGTDPSSRINIDLDNLRWKHGLEDSVGSPFTMVPVAPGSYKEVQIHGQPAVLVRGDWEWPWGTEHAAEQAVDGKLELKWDKKRALQLYWTEGDVLYYLHTYSDVSAEDLIRMAESAQ
ncbi:MAG TPA: hypothetical protein VHP14_01945 [Anaerolineales bacterium]|nr:hypothetical protein [Anaerolineales bacterium]